MADDFTEAGFTVLGIRPRAAVCESDWARAVLWRVGAQRSDAVFRALSKVLHPDSPAGDTRLMRELLERPRRDRRCRMTDVQADLHSGDLDLASLLDILGYQADEHVSLNGIVGGRFTARVATVAEAIEHAPEFAGQDLWFGVNPVGLPLGLGRRGYSADVTRLAALIIELDDAKLSEQAQAELVDDITAVIGQPPAAIVRSGHGQHVYWSVERSDATELSNPEAAVLATRWGYLICKLAARFRGKIDTVFDLARVLRVPGSTNCKDTSAKVPVVGYRHSWTRAGSATSSPKSMPT